MNASATVTLHGTTPLDTEPVLPDDPLFTQRVQRTAPASSGPPDGIPDSVNPTDGRGLDWWPGRNRDTSPPSVPGLTYDHTEYAEGRLRITLLEVHVPDAPGTSAQASDTFGGEAGTSASFALPAGILSGGASGTVSVSRTSTYTASTCTRVTIEQPVEYARHFYRDGNRDSDMVITLLHRVKEQGANTRTDAITDCVCRTRQAPAIGVTASHTVSPGVSKTVTITHANNLNLETTAGFQFELPVVGQTSFNLSATGSINRATSLTVDLPGGYTYNQYDIGGVTYWEVR